MSDYAETWQVWFDAQRKEQSINKIGFPQDKPTLYAAVPFDPEKDAVMLRRAMKGPGTNEHDIISILTKRSLEQRNQIRDQYRLVHGRDLVKDLESELSGNFEKVILSLMKPLPLFLAEQVKLATKGSGTDENALIEIFCTRDDDSIKAIKEYFEKQYSEKIEKEICKDTSGMLEKVLTNILSLSRNGAASSPTDVADKLISEEINEEILRKTLTSHPFPLLKEVFNIYQTKTGNDFLETIKKKSSGDSRNAFKAIYLSSKGRPVFYAHALRDALKGFGTDDWALIRIIVSRCEMDLGTIKEKYSELFGRDLVEHIKSDTSYNYQQALVSLLGN